MKEMLLLALAVTASLVLSGCLESSDITVHKAHQYQGGKDPLLSQNTAARVETLNKRFQLVQLDR